MPAYQARHGSARSVPALVTGARNRRCVSAGVPERGTRRGTDRSPPTGTRHSNSRWSQSRPAFTHQRTIIALRNKVTHSPGAAARPRLALSTVASRLAVPVAREPARTCEPTSASIPAFSIRSKGACHEDHVPRHIRPRRSHRMCAESSASGLAAACRVWRGWGNVAKLVTLKHDRGGAREVVRVLCRRRGAGCCLPLTADSGR